MTLEEKQRSPVQVEQTEQIFIIPDQKVLVLESPNLGFFRGVAKVKDIAEK